MRKSISLLLILAAGVAVFLLRGPGAESGLPPDPPTPADAAAPPASVRPEPAPEPAPESEPESEPAPEPKIPAILTVRFSERDRLLGHERLKSVRVVVRSADEASADREVGVGSDGTWQLEGLLPGEYEVEAVEGADRAIGRKTVVLRPGDSAEISFSLDPPCSVEAEVLGLTAGPPVVLQLWSVALRHGEPDVALPVVSGRAAGEVAPGAYWVHFVREETRLGVFSWTIRTSSERRTFDLRGLVTVSGSVTGGEGATAAARVVFSPADADSLPFEAPVDASGGYSIELPGLRLFAVCVRTERGVASFDSRRFDSDTRLDLSLSETGRLEALFTDRATGRPLADVPIVFSGPNATFTERTDAAGRLRAELQPSLWHATANVNGAQVPALSRVEIRAGETTRVEAALDVPVRGVVAGRVVFDGKPVSGVRVTATGRETHATARTDDRGRFRLAPVFGRTVRVHVLKDISRGTAYVHAEVEVGSRDVLLDLPALAAAAIRFRGPNGVLREKLHGMLQVLGAKTGIGFQTGPDGVVKSLGLPPGRHEVRVLLSGGFIAVPDSILLDLPMSADEPLIIDVVPSVPATLSFDLPFRGWFQVLAEGPAPPFLDTPGLVYASSSEVRIPRAVPPGEYRVLAWSFDGRVAEGRGRLDGDHPRIEMRTARAELSLTLLRPSGAPAAGLDVRIEDASDGAPPLTRRLVGTSVKKPEFTDAIRGRTGEDGRVIFTDLLPGRYRVRLPDREWELDLGERVESRTVWLR